MWRLKKVCHKSSRPDNTEQLRLKRREQERALRQARRDKQLFSKRLLLSEDEEHSTEQHDVVSLFHHLQKCGPEKEASLKALSRALRDPSAQTKFIKLENSIHVLVGLLTGSNTECRLLAVRCLHELSHSPHSAVSLACLPASPYLLTYLSGQSTKFTELCLYTLGNLCPENDAVKDKVLSQGIIPALTNCLETQMHNLALVEAIGFTLSQLLQGTKAAERIAATVMGSRLPLLLCSVLSSPDPKFGLGPVIECAWSLHFLICSIPGDCSVLLSHGTLSKCSSLLVSIGGTVAEEKKDEGLELAVWPLLRCVGNLSSSCPVEHLSEQVDTRLLAALCALLNVYLKTQPALAREAAWVLNNLTAHSTDFCSALLTQNLVPDLIQLLPFSLGINTMILRVLANVAHQKKHFCDQLVRLGLLSALCATLKMADTEMVVLSLDVLNMLIDGNLQVAEEFVKQGGLLMIEALQYNHEGELRQRALYLLEHKLCYPR
ncbi:transmembrane and coiled-coil domain-containing protein 6 [Periophthalmus magnuspinnatus]|uniref:transmembrane and coiled-coil domain-containing protein 6 n=1 Tax=Periophthalmus magnuspinnatus TaxID=409849 RepID=UPI00145A7CDF|nr:transmembrane and coiled-coil domain-containing protein 6 [Periophthalmus magnuspinnatus]